jgi:hypothetical protein
LSFLAVTGPAASQGNGGIAPLLTPVSQTVDRCHKQCAPLLKLDSRSEAKRTYGNCRSLCAGSGMVTCPDGSRVPVSNARRCGSKRSDRPRWSRYR